MSRMTPIYHITHVANLPSIVSSGGISCDLIASGDNLANVSIAHDDIKARRRKWSVTVGPRGTLADYAPFYFAPRSPMLYSIHKGNVENYAGGQKPIVHLVVYVEDLEAGGYQYVFTDGHAVMHMSEQYTDRADLSKIDWSIMSSQWWNDTNEHPDRKWRRQAEFLVYQLCPWALVREVGVIDHQVSDLVTEKLADTHYRPTVSVRPAWYY